MTRRYLASNSKDQSIKLWDLRRFSDTDDTLKGAVQVVRERANRGWDYRWTLLIQNILSWHDNVQVAEGAGQSQIPGDGRQKCDDIHRPQCAADPHQVRHRVYDVTFVTCEYMSLRCHFSPMANTGQKFIYTGCAKGRVVIYDMLTGKEVR